MIPQRLIVVILAGTLAACATAPPAPRPAPVPAPAPKAAGRPAQPRTLGEPAAGPAAPIPAAPTVRTETETVLPTDVVAVAFCAIANSGWNGNRWYLVQIDAVQQAWAGPLEPTPGDTSGSCYQTPKFYSFPEGLHELRIALVNHCEPNDTDTACQACAVQNGGVPCADAPGPAAVIAVTSATSTSCAITVAPATATIPTAGGTGTITVTATGPTCPWTAASDAAWLTVAPTTGQGSGAVTYTAPGTTAGARSGNLTIGGQKAFLTQTGAPCTFRLDPTAGSLPAAGGVGSVAVTLTGGGGCPWSATSPAAWLTITSGSGVDTGSATYTGIANPDPAERSATLTIAAQPFAVKQTGTMTDLCTPGGVEAPTITVLRLMPTNPKAAQPLNPQFQLTSKTAITDVIARMNGAIVGRIGPGPTNLTPVGGLWFPAPAKGTYALTIEIANLYGCHRTSPNLAVTVR